MVVSWVSGHGDRSRTRDPFKRHSQPHPWGQAPSPPLPLPPQTHAMVFHWGRGSPYQVSTGQPCLKAMPIIYRPIRCGLNAVLPQIYATLFGNSIFADIISLDEVILD